MMGRKEGITGRRGNKSMKKCCHLGSYVVWGLRREGKRTRVEGKEKPMSRGPSGPYEGVCISSILLVSVEPMEDPVQETDIIRFNF